MPGATCSWCAILILGVSSYMYGSAQSVSIAITPTSNPAVQQSLVSYNLTCSATSTPGPPTNVTWTSYPAGTVGSLTTSGSTYSRPLTLPSPVVLSYAGLYVCTASANGVSTTASYAFNVTVSTALSPSIMVTNIPPPPNYQGSLLTLTCTFGINNVRGLVPASIQWVGPTQQPLVAGGLVSIQTSNSTSSGVTTVYTSNLTISALSRKDGGSYTCTPTIGPMVPSTYVINYTPPGNSLTVNIIDLPVGVTISPTSLRSSSNSSFQINCTATKPASVPLPFVFTWSWGDRYSGSVLTFNSSGVTTIGGTTFFMSQPPGVSSSTRNVTITLTVSQSLPGVYSYWCTVMVYVPVDGPVNQTATTNVSIPGPPNQPTNIVAKYISMDTVSVQWTVPLIVYTQETYVVLYGSAPGNLSQSSSPVNGSADLSVIGGQFGANLTGLAPSSLYYYTVVASNTEGTTTTPVMNISFFLYINSTITPSWSSSPSPSPSTSYAAYAALVVLPILLLCTCIAIVMVAWKKRHTTASYKPSDPLMQMSYLADTKDGMQQSQVPASSDSKEITDIREKPVYTVPDMLSTTISICDLNKKITEISTKKDGFKKMFQDLHNPAGMTSDTKQKFTFASFIDGYKVRNAYIAAQAPLMNTVKDFWRMVWEFKSMTIVMLCGLDEKAVVQFWPTEGQQTCGVSRESVKKFTSNSVVYQLKVTTADQSHEVSLYHYTGWPEDDDRPERDDDLRTFCSEIPAPGDVPVIVVDNDGIGRISAFITIHAMMEMARVEQKVDFIKFINFSRARCPDFIRCWEHLRLCHEILLDPDRV